MQQIPVYSFTGFLDSGKTKFIQETLEDERFNAGERTLLLVFEEGEEEYDFSTYPAKNVWLEVLDQQTVTTKELASLKSVTGRLRTADLEEENSRLKEKLRSYEDTIERNNLWSLFGKRRRRAEKKGQAI